MGFDLASIFGKGVQEAITSVGDIADKFITTKQEKEEFKLKAEEAIRNATLKAQENAQKELESYLGDIQSAREANVKIQESDKSSWLSKNFAYLMDGFMLIVFGVMMFMIFNKSVPEENKELFYTGFGLLGSYVGAIINFHRGSSKGSEKSGDILRLIAKNK